MTGKIGQGMKEHVRKESRECKTHGETLHSQHMGGSGANPRWTCLTCDRERRRTFDERKAAGETRFRGTVVEPKRGGVCSCGNELPLTGVCDFC